MTQNFASAGAFIVQMIFGIYVLHYRIKIPDAGIRRQLLQSPVSGSCENHWSRDSAVAEFFPHHKRCGYRHTDGCDHHTNHRMMLFMLLAGGDLFLFRYILWSMLGVVSLILDIYFFSLLIMVIASWIAPSSTHPALQLINQLTEPLCASVRKFLPPLGGIDFSPILVFIVIRLIDKYLIVQPLAVMLGIPNGIMMGL